MNNETAKKDLKYIWHPYTQMKDCEAMPPLVIERAEGMRLYDESGNFYYDTISSWWCNVHGHNHPVIKKAIKEQLDAFEHVLFAGFTHRPAVELAERLVSISPPGLDKVFYSDNGSTAVEVALKMSFQYWQNAGKTKKTRFLSLDMSYHGDTLGAMSVSGVGLFNSKFSPLFFDSIKVPAPYCYRCPCGREKNSCSIDCLGEMEKALARGAGEISAVILEPVLMGAGGMIVYPPEYLRGARELTLKYGVHLIADEVATGFGRTGRMFACEHAGITPDLMCLSKGITSGYLPMSATLATEEIFDGFYGEYDELKTFYHGHTFTANPVACAAAVASIDLFESEHTLERVPEIERRLGEFLSEMSDLPAVGDTRGTGVVAAMELVSNRKTKAPFGMKKRIGAEVYAAGLESGLVLRPLGDVIYLFLPLCTGSDDMDVILPRAAEVIRTVTKKAA